MNITLEITNTYSKAVAHLLLSGNTVTVTYTNNRTYTYEGLDAFCVADLLREVAEKGSLGSWVNTMVKPYYPFTEVTEEVTA